MEEYAKKQQKKQEKEAIKESLRMAGKKLPDTGAKASGFMHGFDKFEGAKGSSNQKKNDEEIFGNNQHSANQGGAAFDFDFGGAEQ